MSNKRFHSVVRGIYRYNKSMNKKIVLLSATVFSIVGGYLPVLFGDNNPLDGWSILGGLVGGLFGIWISVYISKRWG